MKWLVVGLCLLVSSAAAQMMMGIDKKPGGAAYQGPGDVVSGAIAFWSFRCYTTAYTGNVADIWDGATGSTTETQLTCSAGGTINQTVNALSVTCAVSCRVKTMTDQTGNGVNLTQATNANRPVFITSQFNGHPSANCTGSPVTMSMAGSLGSQVQPYTITAVSDRTSGTSQVSIFSLSGDNVQFDFRGAGVISIFGNTAFQDATQTDGSVHAFIAIVNGASSLINVDGVDGGTGTNIGNANTGTTGFLCATSVPNNYLIGFFSEGGIWPSGFNGTQRTNMATNMTTYW